MDDVGVEDGADVVVGGFEGVFEVDCNGVLAAGAAEPN